MLNSAGLVVLGVVKVALCLASEYAGYDVIRAMHI